MNHVNLLEFIHIIIRHHIINLHLYYLNFIINSENIYNNY